MRSKKHRFFTSDTHFFHNNIIRLCNRPFDNLDQMHIGLINNWNSVVSVNDEVFILGDFSFRGVTRTNLILSQLNGRKILIQGNHDSECKNSSFDEKYFNLTLDLGGHTVELSHFPFVGQHDTRGEDFRVIDKGDNILLHGHVHCAWKISGRQINVGCDVWDYTPVSEEALIKEIGLIKSTA